MGNKLHNLILVSALTACGSPKNHDSTVFKPTIKQSPPIVVTQPITEALGVDQEQVLSPILESFKEDFKTAMDQRGIEVNYSNIHISIDPNLPRQGDLGQQYYN